MDNGKFIRCRNCEAIHHISAFDRSPVYLYSSGEVQELPANDWRDFMQQHAGHKIEPLMSTGNDYFPTGSTVDPMNAAYIEVTNGEETLLLHRTRQNISEPVRYAVVKGQLVEERISLGIQDEQIRKEMRLHFTWAPAQPLDDAKIDLFVNVFHAVVSQLDPHSVRTGEPSREDENVSYGRLDTGVIDALLTKCSEHFSPSELQSLGRFIDTHNDDAGLMALTKRRSVRIEAY